ncbi:uncharacterized protein LOC126838632 [Adelges cooleyi]|uniref:uncharacterized protein LOC126838632 n=1 Tax=Adelges cooleyi TaxID=133065 RepID=UPI00217FE3B7|nr:uncharacterized protein LOC126838632 [Adelges cooleyi]
MVLKISFSVLYFILAASCMHPNLPEGSISAAPESHGSSVTVGSSSADPNDAAIEYGFMLCRQLASRYKDYLVDRVTRYQFCKYMGGKEKDYVIVDEYLKNFESLQVGKKDWIGLDEFNLLFKNHSINKNIPLEEFVKQRNNEALVTLPADQALWKKYKD